MVESVKHHLKQIKLAKALEVKVLFGRHIFTCLRLFGQQQRTIQHFLGIGKTQISAQVGNYTP